MLERVFVALPHNLSTIIIKKRYNIMKHDFSVKDYTFSLNCNLEQLDSGIDLNGEYEITMGEKFVQLLNNLRDKEVFIDIGGHYGYYSILASKIISCKKIHTFEPDILPHFILKLNNNEYCDGNININKLYIWNNNNYDMITLDKYCSINNITPGIIKMDIEGFEYYALEGMLKTLEKYKPAVLIEYHERILRDELKLIYKLIMHSKN